jgi:uncharacterized protein Veg
MSYFNVNQITPEANFTHKVTLTDEKGRKKTCDMPTTLQDSCLPY